MTTRCRPDGRILSFCFDTTLLSARLLPSPRPRMRRPYRRPGRFTEGRDSTPQGSDSGREFQFLRRGGELPTNRRRFARKRGLVLLRRDRRLGRQAYGIDGHSGAATRTSHLDKKACRGFLPDRTGPQELRKIARRWIQPHARFNPSSMPAWQPKLFRLQTVRGRVPGSLTNQGSALCANNASEFVFIATFPTF